MALRREKPHWDTGKVWVFYWDEIHRWVMLVPYQSVFYFETFKGTQMAVNHLTKFVRMPLPILWKYTETVQ